MADEPTPTYRFRGSVAPSAAVKRPVAARRNTDTPATPNAAKTSSATIDIFDVIDSWGGWWGVSAAEVDAALQQVGAVDTLYVRINSPGGEATEGVAIANLLRAHASTVKVTNYGLAASAASLIAVSGDTLAMAPGSLLMIHEAWNVIRGGADDMRAEAAVLDKISDSYAACYALKGGTKTDWRALMHAETWFTPEDAVAVKLADQVGIDVAPGAPAIPDDGDDDVPIEVNVDIEITPAARAARRFDLSLFRHVPEPIAAAAAALKPPAEAPENTQPKGAVEMTDEQRKALCASLGLPDDADDTAIQTKVDELKARAEQTDPAEVDEAAALAALAKTTGVEPDKVKAAVDGAKAGKVTVSQSFLDTLEANAKLGAEARAKQLADERDAAIDAKIAAGVIGRSQRESWQRDWDRDPASAKAELDKLTEPRFPVGDPKGYAGSDGTDAGAVVFTDDEADALATLAGVSKEALTHG